MCKECSVIVKCEGGSTSGLHTHQRFVINLSNGLYSPSNWHILHKLWPLCVCLLNTATIPLPAESSIGSGLAEEVGAMEQELSLQQRLEMSLRASQCPPQIVPQSDTDRQIQAAIKTEMALFTTTGNRGRFLQLALDSLMTIPLTSVEAERAFSAAGILCLKLRSSLEDTLCLLRLYYCKNQ